MRFALLICAVVYAACGGTAPDTPDASAADADAGVIGEAPDYARLFPADRVLDVDLAINDADWAILMADPLVDIYVPATLTYDGIVVPQIGVRLKGNSSRNQVAQQGGERYSFKVDLDEYVDGQQLLGIDRFNLNNGFKDPTLMREAIGYSLYAAMGVPASRTAFARLTINGELHGLYLVVEQVDREWLRDRFPDDTGDLLKPEMPDGQLTWKGDSFSSYAAIEVKTNEDDLVHASFIHMLDVLNNGALADIGTVIDVDLLLRWLAVNTALQNLDSYVGSGHNYYLYEDRSSGRWVLVPWDVNEAFGNFTCNLSATAILSRSYLEPRCNAMSPRPLVTRVLEDPTWRATYEQYLGELLTGPFAPPAIAAQVDSLATLIRPYVVEDPTKFFTTADFETNLHDDLPRGMSTIFGLTSYTERRATALDAQLP